MTDHPILFSAPMVRALLDGSKTQTRRVLKPQPYDTVGGWQTVFTEPPYFEALDHNGAPLSCAVPSGVDFCSPYPPIKHAIGDRLWVRENFQAHSWAADCVTIRYAAEAKTKGFTAQIEQIPYPAGDRNAFKYIAPKGSDIWRPSIHMPRWASRLTLVVTDVRVQRLQEISEADAVAEGIKPLFTDETGQTVWNEYDGEIPYGVRCPLQSFRTLWNATYSPDAWDQNPWVVATTFTTHHCNIDKMGEVA